MEKANENAVGNASKLMSQVLEQVLRPANWTPDDASTLDSPKETLIEIGSVTGKQRGGCAQRLG